MDLSSNIGELPFVGEVYKTRLKRLNINFIKDLLHHTPRKYKDFRNVKKIHAASPNETVTIVGKITSFENRYTRSGKVIQVAEISDDTGRIQGIWFNQAYLRNVLREDLQISLSGDVSFYASSLAIFSPDYEIVSSTVSSIHTGNLVGMYPETKGVTSKWLRRRIKDALERANITEFLPENILKAHALPNFKAAIDKIHFPNTPDDARLARKRLSFNEFLYYQILSEKRRREWLKYRQSYSIEVDKKKLNKFISSLPFKLTDSQTAATRRIFFDLQKDYPMNRLLEGDVGSGKTIVSAIAAFVVFGNQLKSVFLAPTQILARQHFNSLSGYFKPYGAKLNLLTSQTAKNKMGDYDILVGTHALFAKNVNLKKVALVVIDEQQKFGVEQRELLVNKTSGKASAPHVLVTTATPIPRTVAHTYFGEMNMSVLKNLPGAKKKVKTWVVPPEKREKAYAWIEEQIIADHIQAYVVCPYIEGDEDNDTKAVKTHYAKLKKILPKLTLGILHGKMSSDKKEAVMRQLTTGKIDVLVATPVIEVGIDVPNANIMVVEEADKFGLANLHQLRGRVGRGDRQAFCLLFSDSDSQKALARLEALKSAKSGFELSEMDLAQRGPGELYGSRQSGIPELKIASWKDKRTIAQTKALAKEILKNSSEYKSIFTFYNLKM